MTDTATTILLWLATIGSALIAGTFFAFSTFVMTSFARIEPAQGIAAMNAINTTILGSAFIPVFVGTAVAGVALAVLAFLPWNGAASLAMLAGAIVYVVGSFGCTMAFNVPLNDGLAAFDANDPAALPLWSKYLVDWTFWNHVRTVASGGACVLFVSALIWRS
ncbi:DUF1772 domain-containing protein [Tahibacter soli]|uniref:DUF1772 domain-containing protein n=1 Tax=Tahibacter soli TaxID=2983605 RepID=A0A9X3YS24_9GAMM|nr:anthrone oxygenase family protein [Tahibacter soli]MDC8015301.1 DUF1772 domain-containing protein [Tahibacter soli]